MSEQKSVAQIEAETAEILRKTHLKPKLFHVENLIILKNEFQNTYKNILENKEILFFAILQWLLICLAYKIWIEYYHWVPSDLPENLNKSQYKSLSFVWCMWSLLIVAIVSYPLSLLNACIVNVYYLKKMHLPSSIYECFKSSTRNMDAIWYFTFTDAIATITEVLSRISHKQSKNKTKQTANVGTAVYYAWKVGSVGMLPSLVAGKTFLGAAQDSLMLLKTQPFKTLGIRMGYSMLCWVVGITIYLLTNIILYFRGFNFSDLVLNDFGLRNSYQFYASITVSFIVAVGVVIMVIRPFYLMMISKLYTDTLFAQESMPLLSYTENKTTYAGYLFFCLLIVAVGFYFYGSIILSYLLANNVFS